MFSFSFETFLFYLGKKNVFSFAFFYFILDRKMFSVSFDFFILSWKEKCFQL